jgi:hypothetical protein
MRLKGPLMHGHYNAALFIMEKMELFVGEGITEPYL